MRETYQPPAASPAGPPHDRTLEETPPPAVYGIRHNATESDEPQRKLVPARDARTRQTVPFPFSQRDSPPPAVYGIRHNTTESDEPQRKLVPARDTHDLPHTPRHSHNLQRHSRTLPRHSHTLPRHSREGGNPSPRHGLPPPRSGFLELPPPSRYANQSKRTQGNSHWIHCREVWYNILLYTSRPIVRGHHMIPTPEDRRR